MIVENVQTYSVQVTEKCISEPRTIIWSSVPYAEQTFIKNFVPQLP